MPSNAPDAAQDLIFFEAGSNAIVLLLRGFAVHLTPPTTTPSQLPRAPDEGARGLPIRGQCPRGFRGSVGISTDLRSFPVAAPRRP